MDKYYVYKDGVYWDNIGYDDFADALDVALNNDADEIECHHWDDEESYENYDMADKQTLVWRKEQP